MRKPRENKSGKWECELGVKFFVGGFHSEAKCVEFQLDGIAVLEEIKNGIQANRGFDFLMPPPVPATDGDSAILTVIASMMQQLWDDSKKGWKELDYTGVPDKYRRERQLQMIIDWKVIEKLAKVSGMSLASLAQQIPVREFTDMRYNTASWELEFLHSPIRTADPITPTIVYKKPEPLTHPETAEGLPHVRHMAGGYDYHKTKAFEVFKERTGFADQFFAAVMEGERSEHYKPHAPFIDKWLEFLKTLKVNDPDVPHPDVCEILNQVAIVGGDLTKYTGLTKEAAEKLLKVDKLIASDNNTAKWYEENGEVLPKDISDRIAARTNPT